MFLFYSFKMFYYVRAGALQQVRIAYDAHKRKTIFFESRERFLFFPIEAPKTKRPPFAVTFELGHNSAIR